MAAEPGPSLYSSSNNSPTCTLQSFQTQTAYEFKHDAFERNLVAAVACEHDLHTIKLSRVPVGVQLSVTIVLNRQKIANMHAEPCMSRLMSTADVVTRLASKVVIGL